MSWRRRRLLIHSAPLELTQGLCVSFRKPRASLTVWTTHSLSLCNYIFLVRFPLMRYGASVMWHHSLPLINSFNITETVIFTCRLCFLVAFPFISLIYYSFSKISLFKHNLIILTQVCFNEFIPGVKLGFDQWQT